MSKRFPAQFTVSALAIIAASPTGAAASQVPTGITGIGTSMIIFTVAAAVLLTLVFRAAARHAANYLGTRSGRSRLRRQLRGRGRNVQSDFLLPGAYGGLARIDHALLASGGVFCIRAMHFNGCISGAVNEPQWTVSDGPVQRRFLNPRIQNEGRVRAMLKVLPDVPIANLVVFTGRVQFVSPPPANVVTLADLESYLRNHEFDPGRVPDRDLIRNKLNAVMLRDADSRKDFAAQISFS